jgi:hypothetical protein
VLDEGRDTLLRPASLAAYIALSAAITNCMAVVSSEGTIAATPTLIVTYDANGEAGCPNPASTIARRALRPAQSRHPTCAWLQQYELIAAISRDQIVFLGSTAFADVPSIEVIPR